LWGSLISCVPIANRHARRFSIAAQDAILPTGKEHVDRTRGESLRLARHQLRQYSPCHELPPFAGFACWADAGRATGVTRTRGDQLGGLGQQAGRQAVERRALSDAAGVRVVEIEIGFERGQAGGIFFAQRHAEVVRIAHQQQRGHRAQRVAQAPDAALLLGRREFAQARQKSRREMQPESRGVHFLLRHVELAPTFSLV